MMSLEGGCPTVTLYSLHGNTCLQHAFTAIL